MPAIFGALLKIEQTKAAGFSAHCWENGHQMQGDTEWALMNWLFSRNNFTSEGLT
jgi:hypothetical protein